MSLRLADPPPTYDDSWARRFQDDIENESAYNEDFINGLLIGRTLNVETVVLTANADSTTVNDVNSVTGSVIFLSALNPRAAAEVSTTFAIAGNGSFTVYHDNNVHIDREFGYAIFGSGAAIATISYPYIFTSAFAGAFT